MSTPDTDPDICGFENATNGEPCQHAPSKADGRCHIHTEVEGERAPGGRPRKYEDRREDILAGARSGMTIEGCARLGGVAKDTLYRWLREYDEFSDAFKRARAQGELQHIKNVDDNGSRFILERSFGYTKTTEHAVDTDANVNPGEAYIAALTAGMDEDDDDHDADVGDSQ